MEFTAAPLPEEDAAARAEMDRRDREQYYGPRLNFGFRRAEILADNIGYLDLTVFAPLDWAGESATATMTFLAHTDALIIDLRRNGGGHGEMVQWLASYLLGPEPRSLSGEYSREGDATTQRWSLPYVPGARFGAEKPVYVLTSRQTFSAAEGFAYDLQALKRATVVGERTAGGAHPYENVRLDTHFVLWLPVARSVNPLTGTNWQGGVRPDVEVKADDALTTALRLAHDRLAPTRPGR
jgi:C-terminal processing protease CtpA/Prc